MNLSTWLTFPLVSLLFAAVGCAPPPRGGEAPPCGCPCCPPPGHHPHDGPDGGSHGGHPHGEACGGHRGEFRGGPEGGEQRGPRRPPEEAFTACEGKKADEACSVAFGDDQVNGTCTTDREERLFCRPEGHGRKDTPSAVDGKDGPGKGAGPKGPPAEKK